MRGCLCATLRADHRRPNQSMRQLLQTRVHIGIRNAVPHTCGGSRETDDTLLFRVHSRTMVDTTRRSLYFPNELYREIARNLHQRKDKNTLLSLALVNSVWRHEGQRVLFDSLSNDWYVGRLNHIKTHILFLESILAHPDRLGPCVHLYAQEGYAVNPIGLMAMFHV